MTEKKKLLIYAHYYHPDMASTGQILRELAEGLRERFEVTVICTVPSYLGTVAPEYRTQKVYHEQIGGVQVIRVRVPQFNKTSKGSRVKNILAYFFRAMGASKTLRGIDYVLCVSQPPVLGGMLGVWAKRKLGAKLIYQIQDFNPEQILAVGYSKNPLLTGAMMALDKRTCRNSDLVVTVGRDLLETLQRRFDGTLPCRAVVIHNWVDEQKIRPLPPDDAHVAAFKRRYGLEGKFVIMYSGNIGLYYDLENLMPVMEKFGPGTRAGDGREVVFAFVGAGSMLKKLRDYKEKHHMDNVVFAPYQNGGELVYSLNAADVHWCVNARGLKGVSCPSKYYGLAAAAKPVLAMLEEGTEVRCLLEETRGGLCCDPGDYAQAEANIRWFLAAENRAEARAMGLRGRAYLETHLTREASVQRYAQEILQC